MKMDFANALGDSSRTDSTTTDHVCAFCQTAFDSNDRICPTCDAEIVIRGER